jgi:hypothetical protein
MKKILTIFGDNEFLKISIVIISRFLFGLIHYSRFSITDVANPL